MDEVKDIQKTDSISRFMDTHAVRTNPFGENRAGERAYRRSERIAAGIHLLTNHIDADQPACASIRAGSVELLQYVLELRDQMRPTQSSMFAASQSKIRELISLVRILSVSGHISIQNASTMVEALDDLGNFMTAAQRSMLSENIAISREDFLDVRVPPAARTRPIKDITDIKASEDRADEAIASKSIHMRSKTEGQISVRRQNIIEVLQSGGFMGIKDIATNLPEYSEKMIQRELAELVEGGKVRKTGLKRWSRYSIVAA